MRADAHSGQVHAIIGLLGQCAAIKGIETLHPRRSNLVAIGVAEQNTQFLLVQRLGYGACNRVSTNDQESATGGLGDPKQKRQGSCSQAIEQDGSDDDKKTGRYQQRRRSITVLFQPQGKKCRYRGGYDSPGPDPGYQKFFALVQVGADGRGPDRRGACDQLNYGQQGQATPANRQQGVELNPGRQQDEYTTDEEQR